MPQLLAPPRTSYGHNVPEECLGNTRWGGWEERQLTSCLQICHQMPLPYQQCILKACQKKTFLSCNQKCKHLDLAKPYWDFVHNRVLWFYGFLATNTQGWSAIKIRMTILKITWSPLIGMVEGLWCCGAVFPPKALGTSLGTEHHGLHDTIFLELKIPYFT